MLAGVFAYSQFKMKEQEAARLAAQNEAAAAAASNQKTVSINIHDPTSYKNPLNDTEMVSMDPLPPKK